MASRLAAGRPADGTLVVRAADGEPWSEPAYQSWRRRAFARSLKAVGVERARPYDLRHSFASLLLHEGRSVIYVARQLRHDARLTLTRYGHVIDELDDAPRLEAETAICQAREALVPQRRRRRAARAPRHLTAPRAASASTEWS